MKMMNKSILSLLIGVIASTLLFKSAAADEPVDIVVVPHHGSLTSSSTAFVRHLAPRVAIVSAGFANRWGLPKDVVIDRWVSAGSTILNTAEAGAVSVSLCAEGGIRKLRADRDERRRFWHASSQ